MISRTGPREWENVHFTVKTQLADLLMVDNSAPPGTPQPNGFDALRQAARELDQVIMEARLGGKRVRALGAGWALSDIAITDGYLINTKALNGCFELPDRYFDPGFPAPRRPSVLLAQAGMSMGELNAYLEVTGQGPRRALPTSGIGAGQSVAGAFSGNTHGAGIKFGSTPDFVVGLQLVTGNGGSFWIERASRPVLNQAFTAALGATPLRDDDIFNAAVVSFGSFGVIAAVAVEATPIYQLAFAKVEQVSHARIKERLGELLRTDFSSPEAPYHFEFVFNPYDPKQAMEASARKVAYEPGHATPAPVWIARNKNGFALGDKIATLFLKSPGLSAAKKADIQFKEYRKRAILDGVRGTPGQLFTATVFYFEGYTETAFAVSLSDAPATLDAICRVVPELKQPCIGQVRLVHPTEALLGFTCHAPKTAVFEFGLVNDATFPRLERTLGEALQAAGVPYTLHWSKNSGIDNPALLRMYGADKVSRWRAARDRVFEHDVARRQVFDSRQLERAGLI